MSILIQIIWLLIFTKLFVFWLWLWQLKEYHYRRFLAHFETQVLRKFFYSFVGFRYPKETKKMVALVVLGIALAVAWLLTGPSLPALILTLILVPIYTGALVLASNVLVKYLLNRELARAKKKIESASGLTVVGITGSYGKTGVKEILSEILSVKFSVLKTEKNNNAEIGIARTILNNLDNQEIFIAEIGAYERGKIKQVCDIIKPKIGILTGLNEQHLSTFDSIENIRKAKHELFDSLPPDGIAISKDNLDVQATDVSVFQNHFTFKIAGVGFRVNLPGIFNLTNVLLAINCALKLGMTLEEIAHGCSKIKPNQGGIKIIEKEHLTIIDSSYSSNPTGVMANLNYLATYPGRKVVIMPCLIELGKKGRIIHRQIGDKIDGICDLAIITTKDYFKELKDNRDKFILIEDPQKVKQHINDGDIVLLEGRVSETLKKVL